MSPAFSRDRQARLWVAGGLLLALSGCQKIIGAEERTLASDAGGVGEDAGEFETPSEAQCKTLCDTIEQGCASDGPIAAYSSPDYCTATCAHHPLAADPTSKTGNTYECRLAEAKKAVILAGDEGEGATNCHNAGPGGGTTCGGDCASYCQQFAAICPDSPQVEDCESFCNKLPSEPSLSGRSAFGTKDEPSSDNIQCRAAHLSAAAVSPEPHCGHAALNPDYGPCNPPEPKCSEYCTVVMNVCDGDATKQYDTLADCVKTCENGLTKSLPLDPGTLKDVDKDTVACRRYHAYNAVISGPDHCNHAGPGGDGHCGRVCPAYCQLVSKACAANGFADALTNEAGCLADCAALVGTDDIKKQADYKYNVAKGKAGGNNISCRFYHVVKAFSDPAASCPSALGQGQCAP